MAAPTAVRQSVQGLARSYVRLLIVVAGSLVVVALAGLEASWASVLPASPSSVTHPYPTPEPDPSIYGHIGR